MSLRRGCAAMLFAALAIAQVGPAAPRRPQASRDIAFPVAEPRPPPGPRRVFVSGHSLTDHPFPQYLAAIAADIHRPIEWNTQYLEGSSVKDRSMGGGARPWAGYRAGADKAGRPIDVLAELKHPSTPGGLAYDTLVIAEQHTLLGSIVWNGTLANLRDFHERMIERDPQARTYLFEAWMNVLDLDDPSSWIAYERAAAPLWRCVAGRINHDLAAAGRRDRLAGIPAASALAMLVEQADTVPGFGNLRRREQLALIFRDDVHLTPAGAYYVALVASGVLQGRPIRTVIRPEGMRPDTAGRLQEIAGHFTAAHLAAERAMTARGCSAYVADQFVPLYLAYQRDLLQRDHPGPMIWLRWARMRISWPRLFRRQDASNPFHVGDAPAPRS